MKHFVITAALLIASVTASAQVKVYADQEFEGNSSLTITSLPNKGNQVLTTDAKGKLVLTDAPSNDLQKQIDALKAELEAMRELLADHKKLSDQSQLQLSPNPSKGVFNLQYNEVTPERLTVFDAKGTEVFSSAMSKGANSVDLQHLAKGQYFIRVEAGGKTLETKAIIIE